MSAPGSILFVCLHGAAKSILAAADFQRLAAARGLDLVADAAGTEPDPDITPAVVAARYGKGWAIGVSPHPEQTDGLKDLVPTAIRWALSHPAGETR